MKSLKYWAYTLFNAFFPAVCVSCNQKLAVSDRLICPDCKEKLKAHQVFCNDCGSLFHNGDCPVCNRDDAYFDQVFAVLKMNPVLRSLIHELKYKEYKYVAEFLGVYVTELLKQESCLDKIDIITPVPLHNVKKRIRGFNQAELIADAIGKNLGIQVIPNLIKRTKFTETQTKLNKSERQQNVSKAFRPNKKFNVVGKNIMIVDDVFTTGATMNSICRSLKNYEVGKLIAVTLAHA
jgi:ComF family protein